MPVFGGYTPFPLRLGESNAIARDITRALDAGRGTAYDTTEMASPVWVEDYAIGRAIADVWATNERLGLQTDLSRTTMLARWESIFGIVPAPDQTERTRRDALFALQQRVGRVATRQAVIDALTSALAPISVSVEVVSASTLGVIASHPGGWYVSSSSTTAPRAYVTGKVTERTDVNWIVTAKTASDVTLDIRYTTASAGEQKASLTFPTAIDPGTSLTSTYAIAGVGLNLCFGPGTFTVGDYYVMVATTEAWPSSVAELTVLLSPPATMAAQAYYALSSLVYTILDDMLPAWVRVHLARDYSQVGSFVLTDDTTPNLDNQRLSG